MMVKPICFELERRFQRRVALLQVAGDVLHHDDRVVDHEAGGDGQRHQGQVVDREAGQVHHAEGADQRQRHGEAGNQGGVDVAQEQEGDHHHQRHRQRQLELHVLTEARMVVVRSVSTCTSRFPGRVDCSCGSSALIRSTTSITLARLALDVQHHRRQVVGPGGQAHVLGVVLDAGDVADAQRRAVLVGDDQVAVGVGRAQLVVGVQGRGTGRAVEAALGAVEVVAGHRAAQVLQAQPGRRQRRRVGAHPHRRTLAAADADQADPGDLRDLLCQAGIHQVLDLRQRHAIGHHRQGQDRCVRRVHLAEHRLVRQVVGQQALRGVDRRLDFLLGDIEVALQAELQSDHRGAAGTAGRHLVEPRNLPELVLQRRGDRRGHDLRAGTGVQGDHLDGRVVHFRQRRDRQEAVGDQAESRIATISRVVATGRRMNGRDGFIQRSRYPPSRPGGRWGGQSAVSAARPRGPAGRPRRHALPYRRAGGRCLPPPPARRPSGRFPPPPARSRWCRWRRCAG